MTDLNTRPITYMPEVCFIAPESNNNDSQTVDYIRALCRQSLRTREDPSNPLKHLDDVRGVRSRDPDGLKQLKEADLHEIPFKFAFQNQDIMVTYQREAFMSRSPFNQINILLCFEGIWNPDFGFKLDKGHEREEVIKSYKAIVNASPAVQPDRTVLKLLLDAGVPVLDWHDPSASAGQLEQIIAKHLQEIAQTRQSSESTPTPFDFFKKNKINTTGSYKAIDQAELMLYEQFSAFSGYNAKKTALSLGLHIDQGSQQSFFKEVMTYHERHKAIDGRQAKIGGMTMNSAEFGDCSLENKVGPKSIVSGYQLEANNDLYMFTQYCLWRSMSFQDLKVTHGLYLSQADFQTMCKAVTQKQQVFIKQSGRLEKVQSMLGNSKEFALCSLENKVSPSSTVEKYVIDQETVNQFANYYLSNKHSQERVAQCLGLFLPAAQKKDFLAQVEKQSQAWKKNAGRAVTPQQAQSQNAAQKEQLAQSLKDNSLSQSFRTQNLFVLNFHCHLVSLDDFSKKMISNSPDGDQGLCLPPSRLNQAYKYDNFSVRWNYKQKLVLSHSKGSTISPINFYYPADVTIFFVKVDADIQKKLKKFKGVLNMIKASNLSRTPFNENLNFVFLVDEHSSKYYSVLNSFQKHFNFHTDAMNSNLASVDCQEKVLQLCKVSWWRMNSAHSKAGIIDAQLQVYCSNLKKGDTSKFGALYNKQLVRPSKALLGVLPNLMQRAVTNLENETGQKLNLAQEPTNLVSSGFLQELMIYAQTNQQSLYQAQLMPLIFKDLLSQQLKQVQIQMLQRENSQNIEKQTVRQYIDIVSKHSKSPHPIRGQPPVLSYDGVNELEQAYNQCSSSHTPFALGDAYENFFIQGLVFVRTYFGMITDLYEESSALLSFPFVKNAVELLGGQLDTMDTLSLIVNEWSVDPHHAEKIHTELKTYRNGTQQRHSELIGQIGQGRLELDQLIEDTGLTMLKGFTALQVMGLADAIGITIARCLGNRQKSFTFNFFFDKVQDSFYAPYISF